MTWMALLHLGLHAAVPGAVALLFFRPNWKRAWLIMLSTMLVDLDHLLADPIYDPQRCGIGFHPLHGYPAIAAYTLFLIPRPTRLVALGLVIHMALDALDCVSQVSRSVGELALPQSAAYRAVAVGEKRISLAFALSLPLALLVPVSAQAIVELRHAHGIGYSADGNRILIPNHYGIAVYSEGRWSKAPGPAHDYMGFVVTREFIFSSGHVAGSRGVSNPLGLKRSGDGGQSWTTLAFEGEVEFHLVAAGYLSNSLYVYNSQPNSAMPRAGIYRKMGERLVGWRGAAGRGLHGEPGMLTAHPTEAATIAVATTAGVFISQDGGDEFRPILTGSRATAARFTLEGEALLAGTLEGKQPGLFRIAIKDGLRQELALPPFGRDAVANIAQNPVRRTELALISFERAVFVSPDGGKTWKRIARPRGTLPGS